MSDNSNKAFKEKRMRELLQAASNWLKDGKIPLTHEFLVENEITSQECYDLAQTIADVIERDCKIIGEYNHG